MNDTPSTLAARYLIFDNPSLLFNTIHNNQLDKYFQQNENIINSPIDTVLAVRSGRGIRIVMYPIDKILMNFHNFFSSKRDKDKFYNQLIPLIDKYKIISKHPYILFFILQKPTHALSSIQLIETLLQYNNLTLIHPETDEPISLWFNKRTIKKQTKIQKKILIFLQQLELKTKLNNNL